MADLNMQIELTPAQQVYAPGAQVSGTIMITSPEGSWECDSMELILFWRTSGIGTRDEGIAHQEKLCEKDTQMPSHYTREFHITLPLHPYTYDGKVIKIGWYLGLYVKKGWLSRREVEVPLVISPPERIGTLSGALDGGVAAEIYYDEAGQAVG